MTARRLGSATAVAAALVGALALPASAAAPYPAPERGTVVISAVQHDVPGRAVVSNRALNREWVDVSNTSRRDVNLSGWTLSDAEGHSYTFRHYQLEGRATVRVHTGEGRDTVRDLYQDRSRSVWNRDADSATLRNDRGRYVDSTSWGLHHRRDVDDRHAFGHRGDSDDRHGFGDRRDGGDRHGFGDRREGGDRHGFDDRHGFGDRREDGDRHGFGHRGDADDRHGFGDRRDGGDRHGFGDRRDGGDRHGFGDRREGGDRGAFGHHQR
ncbi:lamin tail domain-containing protein [Streptomyces sasae]|uniref:lamin tail domain-containing protein n=1 Tax=Streptomyces sasae TaxID=1266772 RepID=UPI00292ED3B7|nr:lamin tail domain-containing protein [Streptomyces sasae]